MIFFRLVTLISVAISSHIFGDFRCSVGPEIYFCERNKEGGSHQKGAMYGGRLTLESFCFHSIYLAADAFVACGELKGKNKNGRPLVSKLTDQIYEGRLGYLLPRSNSYIVPFIGYGYFHEKNSYRPPSRLPCTYDDTFNYSLVGFLSGFYFTPLLSVGLNFETKFMTDGKSKVTKDPDFDDITMSMNNELQARVEIPLIYFLCQHLQLQLVPFYEFRHFGGREDFPFDFIDTKFHLIGLRFALGGCF